MESISLRIVKALLLWLLAFSIVAKKFEAPVILIIFMKLSFLLILEDFSKIF